MKVLYVADNPFDVQLLKGEFALRASHIEAECVETLASARARLKQSSPDVLLFDLVLSDMTLPDGSGVSLVHFLRECRLQIPVVLIVSNENEENALSALRAGVDDYVLKSGGYLSRLPIIFETVLHRYQAGIVREQAALRASEEYFRSLIENSSDIILVLDGDGLILYASPSVDRLLGHRSHELTGLRGIELIHPDDHNDFARILARDMTKPGLQVSTTDIRIRNKDGSWRYVEGVGKNTRNESGQTEIILNLRDITERKLYEQRILESERSLNGILAASPIGIGRLRSRTVDWVNEEMCRLSGYTFHELKGNSTRIFFESDEDFERTGSELYSQGRAEHRFVRKDGSVRDVVIRISPTDSYSHIFVMSDITAQKQTENALRFTQFSVDRASNGIVWEGRKGEILYVNDAACEETGYSREELLSMTAFDIDPDLTPQKFASDWERRPESGSVFFEARHRHKAGRIYPVEVSSSYLTYNGNEYRCAIVRDITERKIMEEKIRESEEHYKKLIHTTPEAITIFDVQGNITFASPRSHATFEVPPGVTVIGQSMFDYIDGDDHAKITDALRELLSRKNILRPLLVRLRRYDGRPFWGEVTASYLTDEKNDVKSVMAVIRDVSERKGTEEALRASQENYRAIFENTVLGIAQVTLDGRYLSLNPAMARMFGYDSPEEMIDSVKDIGEQVYVRPEERELFRGLIKASGRIEGLETERYRKDGSRIWVCVHSQAVYDEKGNILYCQGTTEDITERKRLESQLRQAQKMEALGTLAGGIAHDFNNILTVITGYCTLLQMQMDEADPQRVYVDPIFSASQKAASLTRSLLAFSRQQPISLKRVGLGDVVKGTEKLLKRLLTEDITLETAYANEEITIMADATQIDQILFNLATNARDAMPKGGTLTIETKSANIDDSFINRHGFGEPGQYALLSVSDTGTGMDERTKEHIFDPFFTTKEVGKGTGLGLSTVYGAIKQHNGYITVSSEKEKGTTFHIYLPAIKAGADSEEKDLVQVQRGKERILVAEDNEAVRRLVRDLLVRYGYTCIEAVDGDDAVLKFALHGDVELLIIDSVMPKKNGREVYDEIARTNPRIKVLFMSGYTRDIILDKGIEEGQVDFLSKPIVPKEFLKKVREILDR
jgi:two-component system, cell cycle sensor histidine kinase and response regulator CckA